MYHHGWVAGTVTCIVTVGLEVLWHVSSLWGWRHRDMYRHCGVGGIVTCIVTVGLEVPWHVSSLWGNRYRDMYRHCGVTRTVTCIVIVGLQVPWHVSSLWGYTYRDMYRHCGVTRTVTCIVIVGLHVPWHVSSLWGYWYRDMYCHCGIAGTTTCHCEVTSTFYLPQFREQCEITWEWKRAQVIVSVALGMVRRAVVQLLLSLKFSHSLGVYSCSFCLCCCFIRLHLPVQLRKQLVKQEISSIIKKGIIQEVEPVEGQVLSNIFLREKKDGSQRVNLNLKFLNETIDKYILKWTH